MKITCSRRQDIPEHQPTGTVMVEARDLHARRGDRNVLEAIDLRVAAGEFVALVGPNGTGKSTLLSVLAGDLEFDSGSVRFLDRPLDEWTPSALSRRRAVLTQKNDVSFPFTVRDVVSMGRSPWINTGIDDDDEVVDEALATADIVDLADRSISGLSGGEAARVAFARMLAQRTQLVMLDEPTAALDIHHAERTLAAVHELTRTGCAALVVLHNLEAAAAYADLVAVLDAGRIVAFGKPTDTLTSELLSTVYAHDIRVTPDPVTGTPMIRPVPLLTTSRVTGH